MKKSLAALAVLGAFAGSAFAADVTLYGLVDYGFNYTHYDADYTGVDDDSSFQMKSGQNSGSRFGLRGSEDLGNGLKVGFVLENGFDADTGALGFQGRLFGRESQAYLEGSFGKVSFGRMGQLASANGTYGLLGAFSPFSTGWGNTVGPKHVMANGCDRFDNMISYQSPNFAGFTVYAQYSFKNNVNNAGDENKSNTDRYYGIGATYKTGNLALLGVVDSINYANASLGSEGHSDDDMLTVTLGGTYDFEVVKLYAIGQYFDNAYKVGAQSAYSNPAFDALKVDYSSGYYFNGGMEGYGMALGVSAPAFGGTAKAQAGYMDAECIDDADYSVSRFNFSVGYDYNLSKRTSLYTAANFTKDDYKHKTEAYNAKPQTYEIMAGMIHRF